MVVQFSSHGDWGKTRRFLGFILAGRQYAAIDSAAQRGLEALRNATPVDTGLTAASWSVEVKKSPSRAEITWKNTNIHNGFPVAIGIQYGHGTGTGGYVAGLDYINPAIRPVFDEIANTVWRAVTSA
jgi:hypothetical protein